MIGGILSSPLTPYIIGGALLVGAITYAVSQAQNKTESREIALVPGPAFDVTAIHQGADQGLWADGVQGRFKIWSSEPGDYWVHMTDPITKEVVFSKIVTFTRDENHSFSDNNYALTVPWLNPQIDETSYSAVVSPERAPAPVQDERVRFLNTCLAKPVTGGPGGGRGPNTDEILMAATSIFSYFAVDQMLKSDCVYREVTEGLVKRGLPAGPFNVFWKLGTWISAGVSNINFVQKTGLGFSKPPQDYKNKHKHLQSTNGTLLNDFLRIYPKTTSETVPAQGYCESLARRIVNQDHEKGLLRVYEALDYQSGTKREHFHVYALQSKNLQHILSAHGAGSQVSGKTHFDENESIFDEIQYAIVDYNFSGRRRGFIMKNNQKQTAYENEFTRKYSGVSGDSFESKRTIRVPVEIHEGFEYIPSAFPLSADGAQRNPLTPSP